MQNLNVSDRSRDHRYVRAPSIGEAGKRLTMKNGVVTGEVAMTMV